jgi:uncharacterized protein (DUF1778 family)
MRTELKNRPRHVVFRVSDEEHKYLSQACSDTGVRSLSEFVRQAALHYADTQRSHHSLLSDDLTTVALRLEEVDTHLRELSRVIKRVLGPTRRTSPSHGELSQVHIELPLERDGAEDVSLTPLRRPAERFAPRIAFPKSSV